MDVLTLCSTTLAHRNGYQRLRNANTGNLAEEQKVKTLVWMALIYSLATTAKADDWRLVWSDEFDKARLPDFTKWGYETGFIRNHEKQFYARARQENTRVENSMPIIEARKENYATNGTRTTSSSKVRARSSRTPQQANYTSASLTTHRKAAWNYGRIVVRAKLPAGRGTWPVIWTLGANIDQVGWPACGEIDIMELVGFEPRVVHADVDTREYNHAINTGKGDKITVADLSGCFHVYAIEWDAQKIDFFIDDHKYFSFRNEQSGTDAWPYDKAQYLILNLAIGGDWGGQQGIDDWIFPQRYYIDYVRVY